jgi:hypothetical protein
VDHVDGRARSRELRHERALVRRDADVLRQAARAAVERRVEDPPRGRVVPPAEEEHVRLLDPEPAQRPAQARAHEAPHARVALHDDEQALAQAARAQVADRRAEGPRAHRPPVEVVEPVLLDRGLEVAPADPEAGRDPQAVDLAPGPPQHRPREVAHGFTPRPSILYSPPRPATQERPMTTALETSSTTVDEIAAGLYRLSTPVPVLPGGFSFNQYLIDDQTCSRSPAPRTRR